MKVKLSYSTVRTAVAIDKQADSDLLVQFNLSISLRFVLIMRILLIEAKMYRCNFQMAVSARRTNSTNERFSVECRCAKMLKRQIKKMLITNGKDQI